MIKSKQKQFDITLNDALFGCINDNESYLIPVSVETDYFDAIGKHQDGEVVFSGIALWQKVDILK